MSSRSELQTVERFFWPALSVALLLLIWFYAVRWSGTKVFPSPLAVEKGIAGLIGKNILWRHMADSLRRVAAGFGGACLIGIPAGLLLGWYPALNQMIDPAMQILRPISPLAWIPVSIVLFGIGDRAAIFLIFLAAFFPIAVACADAVRTVPPFYRQAGQNLGLTPGRLLARVIFPACLPRILIGLRLALGIAWLVLVAGEMIAVDSGLGYLVIDSRNSGKRYDLVVAAMLIIGVIGLVLDLLFRGLGRMKSVRWGFRDES